MTRLRRPRALLWLLLAAALFVRAFLPEGTMPGRSDSGAIAVRICGSHGLAQIPLNDGAPGEKAPRAEPPCAFAGLGTPTLPPPATLAAPAPQPAEPAFAEAGIARDLPESPLRLPPARGPPLAA